MPSLIISLAIIAVLYVLWRWVNRTDMPKINGIPEILGWPLFGSLIELGEYHAKVAQQWASKYGPVFQVKLGNKVGSYLPFSPYTICNRRSIGLKRLIEDRFREYI